jgi:hypothetical protein
MARRQVGVRPLLAVALFLAGCGGESTGPTTGSLVLDVSGLPAGVEAEVNVSGPNGFIRQLGGSETLNGLAFGSYTVTAAGVVVGPALYAASPSSQAIVVSGDQPANAAVAYRAGNGELSLTVADLPGGTPAAVTVAGPGGYNRQVTATETLHGLLPGQYTVTALPVSSGGEQYSPAPVSQATSVGASGTAMATVNYSTGGATGFNLRVDGVYLVQSVQTYPRGVPLVKDRDALLRVFVSANQVNSATPDVLVSFYRNGLLISTATISAPGLTTPLGANESALNSSWNLVVSKTLIQPNLSIVVEVDPGDTYSEGNEADNSFPQSGPPIAIDVRAADLFSVRFIPVKTKADDRVGNVSEANRNAFLDASMRMHPLASFDAEVSGVYTTSTSSPLQAGNENGAWNDIVAEILALRTAGTTHQYYYGVVSPSYNSGVAGVGYIGAAAAMGWDKLPSGSSVAAHEWGHNWSREHAPCGDPTNPDTRYPYSGGEIGVIGYDFGTGMLKPAASHDIMGYCADEWISDYTYTEILDFRNSEALMANGMGEAIQPALLVWGRIENGRAVLQPAFRITTRPSLPRRPGPYRLEGRAADGAAVFGFDFTPFEVADDRKGAKHFAFAVPLRPERAATVASLHLVGGGIQASLSQVSSQPATVEARRSGAGRVALRWDAVKSPMIMVRDPVSGDILSFARGGAAEVETSRADLSLTMSDQVGSRDLRVSVESR